MVLSRFPHYFTQYIKNECECFISGSKHRKTDESTRPQAECFYCCEVLGTPDERRSTSFWYSFLNELPIIIVCKQQLQNVIKMVSLECATWELTNLLLFITSVYCARWMSQPQGFGFPKLLTRKRLLSILFRNLRFTRTNGRYRFVENQWTFGYCIQISKDLDTISKSLKIFIQFFIGCPNTCT